MDNDSPADSTNFPLGSAWQARGTDMNKAQDIPVGAKFRIVYLCPNFISLYSEKWGIPNLKVPRSAFGQNFEQDVMRPKLTAGFRDAHYPDLYVADASRVRR